MMNIEIITRSRHWPVVAVLWAVALIVVLLDGIQAKAAVESLRQAQIVNSISIPSITASRTGLLKPEYEDLVGNIARLHPKVEIRAEPDGIVVNHRDLDGYQAWRLAVMDVTQSKQDVVWRPTDLCVGEKCAIAAFTIKLSGEKVVAITENRHTPTVTKP